MADRTSTVRVNVITDASGAGASLGKFGRVAGVAALGVGALAVGAAVGVDKLAGLADVSDDANAKIANVVKTMKLFRGETEQVTQRVQDQAKALSLSTAVDINSIKATQAKLLTFKELAKTADVMGGKFDRATQASVDMAALGFGTAESNAVQLGKALQDPANGLTALGKTGALTKDQIKAIGDEFKRTGDISAAQEQILAAVETQVKGTAEATAGGFELMKNRVSIFAQELGVKLLPYLDRFGTFMIETGGPALVRFGRAVSEKVLPFLRQLGTFISEQVIPVLADLVGWINEHVVPVMKGALADALEGARGLFKNVAKAVKDNEGDLRDLWAGFKKVAEFIVDKVVPIMSDFMKTTLPLLGKAIGTAIGIVADITAHFKTMWDQLQDVIGAIKSVIDWLGKIHVPDIDLPHIPGTGRVSGDSGGSAGGSSPFTHTPTRVTINFNGLVTDPRGTAREVEKALRRNRIALGTPSS